MFPVNWFQSSQLDFMQLSGDVKQAQFYLFPISSPLIRRRSCSYCFCYWRGENWICPQSTGLQCGWRIQTKTNIQFSNPLLDWQCADAIATTRGVNNDTPINYCQINELFLQFWNCTRALWVFLCLGYLNIKIVLS